MKVVVPHPTSAIHCINPDCQRPYPQLWGHNFCNSCGAPLLLKSRYVPLEKLGSGGFAQIYTVWDLQAQTEKVLKVLVEASPKALELFAQEAAVLSSIRHPGVPIVEADGSFQVHLTAVGTGEWRPLPCLVMEKIPGQTLEEILAKNPQGCPQQWVLDWLIQATEILQVLHIRQILHRDIKPSNLMLRASTEQLVLIDFGGAKHLGVYESSSTRLYSPGYSPPEQVAGANVGPSADLYALGRTMIELLTGKSLLELEDPLTGDLRWRRGLKINEALANLLDEMVNHYVRSRPENAAIVHKRLRAINQPSSPPPPLPPLPPLTPPVVPWLTNAATNVGTSIGNYLGFILNVILNIIQAGLDIIVAMVLTATGACIGTVVGHIADKSRLGLHAGDFFAQYLPRLLPVNGIETGSQFLLFGLAGLGTAWGLTAAGSFEQRRQYIGATVMGFISYGFAWVIWQITGAYLTSDGLLIFIGTAAAMFPLGLGIRSHILAHSLVSAAGSAGVFACLILLNRYLNLLSLDSLHLWQQGTYQVGFFTFLGLVISFWLGVSYYIILPGLRFLGLR
jgi:hypothetical protein